MLPTGDARGVYVSTMRRRVRRTRHRRRSAGCSSTFCRCSHWLRLSYMDRINISFASLQMNSDLHFSASVYGFGREPFLYWIRVVRGAVELRFGAGAGWRASCSPGIAAARPCSCAHRSNSTCCGSCWAWRRRGLSRGSLLPHAVVSRAHEARAVSGFTFPLPLSSVVMGSLAGWLLGLAASWGSRDGSGCSWWRLPTAVFSLVILKMLPDGPRRRHG